MWQKKGKQRKSKKKERDISAADIQDASKKWLLDI